MGLPRPRPPNSMLRALLCPALLVPLLGSQALAQGSEPITRSPDFQELSERWGAAMEGLNVPGMAVVVVEGDEVLHLETFGIRNCESEAPVNPETMFYIASATKPYVAMALLQCVDEGKLDLDEPVRTYLPRFELADEAATQSITARDLLSHKPGINSSPIVFLDAYTGGITDDRYFHFLKQVQPTGKVTYTNVHITLAGHLLQAVDGRHWKESLKARIFEPLGMKHTTGYATWMYAQDNVAMPTVLGPGGFEHAAVRKIDETMHAAGGLGTSISDAAHWLRLNLGRGEFRGQRLVSEELIEEMFALQSETDMEPGVDGFGLGWMHGTRAGEVMMQHGGGYIGTATHFSFLPEVGIGCAVLVNSSGEGNILVDIVRNDVYAHLLVDDPGFDKLPGAIRRAQDRQKQRATEGEPPLPPNPAKVPGALSLSPEKYVGVYRDQHMGDIEITWDGEVLHARMGNVPAVLSSRGEDVFYLGPEDLLNWEARVRVSRGSAEVLEIDDDTGELRFVRIK